MYIIYYATSTIIHINRNQAQVRATERIMQMQPQRDRYARALLDGDQEEASKVVAEALRSGMEAAVIYMEILGPALARVGDAWGSGDLNVAAEHLATSITLQQLAYIRYAGRRRDDVGATVVVAAVEGELHHVGSTMIADLFHMDGWQVADLGGDTPTQDLIELVSIRKPDLVVLSVSLPDRADAAIRAATLLKSLDSPPPVFIGGGGISSLRNSDATPADLLTSDPMQAIRTARDLLGIGEESRSFDHYLKGFGQRVSAMRRERGWTQQELANRAGLDRTYLSTVEQGRQNLTMGAAFRIASAFDAPLSQLMP